MPGGARGPHFGRRKSTALAAVVCAAVLALGGCGYHFAGDRNPVVDIQSVHIPPMTNTTTKVGIETLFTNDLIFEVNRHGEVAVVGREAADAVLEGVIRDLFTGSVSRRSITTTLERRVSVTVVLALKSPSGKVLWQGRFSDSEAYTVQADKTSTEGNLRRALAVVSRRVAEKFHYQFNASF